MSKVEVDQVDPQSGTTLTLGTSGDTVSIPSGVTLANAGTATGFPAPTSGIAASAIDSGTIATARLGSGTASSSTFLRGDQTYAAAGGGKINQVIANIDVTSRTTTSTSFVTASSSATINITPSATSSNIYVVCTGNFQCNDGNDGWCSTIYRDSSNLGNATSGLASGNSIPGVTTVCFPTTMTILDSPNTTSQVTYQLYVKVIDVDGDGGNINIGNTVSGSANPVPTLITAFEVLA